MPEIEGKDCGKEDDEVAEKLNSDAQPPVGHVAEQNGNEEGMQYLSSIDTSIHSFVCPPVGHVADFFFDYFVCLQICPCVPL